MVTAVSKENDGTPAERLLAAGGVSVIAAGSAAVWYFDPSEVHFLPVCLFFKVTGLACPGCGLTRGFHALFHGDVLTALDFNVLTPFFALLILFGVFSMTYYAASGKRIATGLLNPKLLWTVGIVLLAFGVLRNLPWYPFNWLFP